MKKYYLLSLLALAPIANAEEQTVTNIYTDVVLSDPNNILKPDISDASIYKVGSLEGDAFTGNIDATTNLKLSYTVDYLPISETNDGNQLNTQTAFSISSDITANDIDMTATLADKVWVSNILVSNNSNTRKITASNFSITVGTQTYNPWFYFKDIELNLSGNFTIKLADGFSWKVVRVGTGDEVWNIGGKLLFDCKGNLRQPELRIQNFEFTAAGGIHFENQSNESRIIIQASNYNETNIAIGGLNNSYQTVLAVQAANAKDVNLRFTNSESYDALVSFMIRDTNETGKFNITMDATQTKGKQTLRFGTHDDSKFIDNVNVTNRNISDVEVLNGTLEIGMYEGMRANSLYVYGDNAAFSSTSNTEGKIGNSYFTTLEFAKGTLVFDYSIDGENDKIAISSDDSVVIENEGKFIVSSLENTKIVLESENDIKAWLESGDTIDPFTIITFEGTNLTSEQIANLNVDAGEGLNAILSAIETDGVITGIQATITLAVPEPATVAGIFGALALAFAIYRRRK